MLERKFSDLSKFVFDHFNTRVVMELESDAVNDISIIS